ncbi:MAG: hypothetical protein ACHREM_08225 [Polyangiales bacterium]
MAKMTKTKSTNPPSIAHGNWQKSFLDCCDLVRDGAEASLVRKMSYSTLFPRMWIAFQLFQQDEAVLYASGMTPELLAALASPSIVNHAKNQQKKVAEFKRTLLANMAAGAVLTPRSAAAAFRKALEPTIEILGITADATTIVRSPGPINPEMQARRDELAASARNRT